MKHSVPMTNRQRHFTGWLPHLENGVVMAEGFREQPDTNKEVMLPVVRKRFEVSITFPDNQTLIAFLSNKWNSIQEHYKAEFVKTNKNEVTFVFPDNNKAITFLLREWENIQEGYKAEEVECRQHEKRKDVLSTSATTTPFVEMYAETSITTIQFPDSKIALSFMDDYWESLKETYMATKMEGTEMEGTEILVTITFFNGKGALAFLSNELDNIKQIYDL